MWRCQPVWSVTGAIMMFTPDHVTEHSSPTPDEPRVAGAIQPGQDATDGAAGGAVASAALRPRSPVAVPGNIRSSREQGRAGRSNAETGATLFPVPAQRPFLGAVACCDTIPSVATRASHRL